MSLGSKIEKLLKEKDINVNELSNRIEIPATTLYSMIKRDSKKADIEVLIRIAKELNVTVDEIISEDYEDYNIAQEETTEYEATNKPSKGVKIPVLGSVAAGVPIEAIEDIIDYEEISKQLASTGNFFALQIKGDSMSPRICDKDVVIVKQQNEVENGDIAIVLVNGDDATCKKVIKKDTGIMLMPLNNEFEPMFFGWSEVQNLPVAIIGKVVELRGKF